MVDVKTKALELAHASAMRIPPSTGIDPHRILSEAKIFENYLSGSEERDTKQNISFSLAASVAHEAIRALQIANNEEGIALPWYDVSKDIRDSCVIGVKRVWDNPDITVEELHDSWVKTKTEQGWKYGPVRNAELKEHHCLVPYDQLSAYDKSKDLIFLNVVKAALRLDVS